ncbi:MAG: Dolichyl-phosphate-mannose-protein mannosyltransferase [Verrucomicrobiaceae bacterium]|nr:Dolichyl-phosphate-mannose-protein mannosyltransferase [Verrucomicrobiaceae bacterium]
MAADTLPSLPASSQVWTRRFCWLLAGVVVFRVLHLFMAIDFQLSADEAYYWDWGRRLDWCYYSKPPLIGWLMGAVGRLSGDKWWAVRLAAMLLGSVSLGLLFLLGKKLFDARTGFFAALLLLLTPANWIANLGLTIDAPLLLCWTAALLFFWKMANEPRSPGGWLCLTLVVGIGTLAKQMMLAFPGMMVIFALSSPEHRTLLKRPAFWLCIMGSLAFLSPMIWWNTQHHGVTLEHTLEHFNHKDLGWSGTLVQFLTFPVVQAGVYSPITFAVLVTAMILVLRTWRSQDLRNRFLLTFSAPGLAVVMLLALRQNIGPNWPAVFYVPLFVLAAALASSHAALHRWMLRGLKLGGACALVFYAFLPLVRPMGWAGNKRLDPAVAMRGWQEAGVRVGELMKKMQHPERTFVLVLDHRRYASQMAFSMPQHPRVYRWTESGKVESQYEIWPGFQDKVGWDCFVIYPDSEDDNYRKSKFPPALMHAFDKWHKLGDVNVDVGNGVRRSFQLFQCKRMLHYPIPEPEIPQPSAPAALQ